MARGAGVGECATRAHLARRLGVTRSHVTQVVGLLELAPEVVNSVAALGDPLPRADRQRALRPLLKLPAEEQRARSAGCLLPPRVG